MAAQQEKYRRVSTSWHRFFNFGSQDIVSGRRVTESLFSVARSTVREKRLQRLRQVDLLGRLQQLLRNPQANFRGNQKDALDAVIRGFSPVLQITRTGGGKSLTFLLPSYCSNDGTTIVVVPFVALQDDLQKRCISLSIRCEIWSTGEIQTAPIILITPESFTTKRFRDFLNRLAVRQQLDRIVLDECHTVLDSSYDFRPQLRTIGGILQSLGTQLVFLTAILPPRDEEEFFTTLYLDRAKAVVIRQPTTRPNIQYGVREVTSAEEEDLEGVEIVKAGLAESWDTAGLPKIIIYCQRIDRAEELAEQLNCGVYHSKVGTTAEKSRIVEDWVALGGPIVATAALGAGVDISDIRGVVHIGLPKSLRDFVQESGRSGRDGFRSASIVVFARSSTTATEAISKWVSPEKEDITEYVRKSIGCRRTILSRVMDGVDRGSCQEEEEACDLCTKGQLLVEPSPEPDFEQVGIRDSITWAVGESLERNRQVARETEDFIRRLRFWKDNCVVCYHDQPKLYKSHPFGNGDCQLVAHNQSEWDRILEKVQEVQKILRSRKEIGRYTGCYYCFIPQRECSRWVEQERDSGSFTLVPGGECCYMGVMEAVVGFFLLFGRLRDRDSALVKAIIRRCGQWVEDGATIEELLRVRIKWGKLEASGVCVVFSIIASILERD